MSYTSSSPASSTATLLSTYAAEKTILAAQPVKPAKDYSAAFASLQSQYGFVGGNVAPTAPLFSAPPKVKKTKQSAWWKFSCSASRREAPPAPTTTSRPVTPEKDFEAAFGQLQSSFGFGAPVPVRSHKKRTSTCKT